MDYRHICLCTSDNLISELIGPGGSVNRNESWMEGAQIHLLSFQTILLLLLDFALTTHAFFDICKLNVVGVRTTEGLNVPLSLPDNQRVGG
jgi:hypothetical protein